ncbi:MAG: hypothetical protein RLW61_14115 [Gammaproteobacteria bacterium]
MRLRGLRFMCLVGAAFSAALYAASLHAAQIPYHAIYLADPDPGSPFVGKTAGPDLLWGTADDVAAPGRNAPGNASTFDNGTVFGYFSGTYDTVYDDATGAFVYTQVEAFNKLNCSICVPPFFDAPGGPIVLSTTSGGTNGGQYFLDQTFVASLDTIDPEGNVYRASGAGLSLFKGQNPADFTSDPGLLTHLETVIPRLPANWGIITVAGFTVEAIAGPLVGSFSAEQSITAYTVVPTPGAALLLTPALLLLGRKGHARLR